MKNNEDNLLVCTLGLLEYLTRSKKKPECCRNMFAAQFLIILDHYPKKNRIIIQIVNQNQIIPARELVMLHAMGQWA